MKRSLLALGLVLLCTAVLLVTTTAPLPAAGKSSPCPADMPVNVWVAATGDPAPAEWVDGTTKRQMGLDPFPYRLVPDAKGSWYTTGKGSSNIDAHFQLSNCTADLSINLSGASRTLTAYLPAADKGSLSVWWLAFDKAWGTPTPTSGSPTGITPLPLTEGPYATGDATDADGHWYFRRTMGSMGNDLLTGDSRLPMNPLCPFPLCSQTSSVRVYHPDANTWVFAPELNGDDWVVDLVRLKANGSYVRDELQSYPFKIVVCKTTATCNVHWPNP